MRKRFDEFYNKSPISPLIDTVACGMGAMFLIVIILSFFMNKDIPLKLMTTHIPEAVWYDGYETTICVSGGAGEYIFEFEPKSKFMELGLFCDPNNGVITGTPQPTNAEERLKPYSLKFHVIINDKSGQNTESDFELRITPVAVPYDPERQPLELAVDLERLPDAWTNESYKYTPPIRGGIETYELKWEGLPTGLKSDSKGHIHGKIPPSAVPSDVQARNFKDYVVQLIVTDQQSALLPALAEREPQVNRKFQLRVHQLENISLTSILPHARAGQQYEGAIVAKGGKQKLIWQSDDLDRLQIYGFTLDPHSGLITAETVITSDATRAVPVSFQVHVTDPSKAVEPKSIEGMIRILPPMRFMMLD